MVCYELCMLLRTMPKPQVKTTLKRVAQNIFNKGGIVRKLENLGHRDTPYRMSSHGQVHRQASYFIIEMNMPPSKVLDLKDELSRDVDIIRQQVYKVQVPDHEECTLHQEMQPPPYRKDVQELVEQARKLDKPKFEYNTGLDYYPFQK